MKILSLDLATKTGWAVNITGNRCGTIEFALKRGESPGMRFLRCRAWLNEMFKLLGDQIDVIAYEQAHHRGGAATSVCVGLVTETLAFAADKGIETMPVQTATLKKWAAGNGRASKADMIEAAKAWGWNPENDDEADAALILEYALSELTGTVN